MQEIVKIYTASIGSTHENFVNLRDIHKFLEIKKHFADWAKTQISRFRLIEGRDYVIEFAGSGPRKRTEYKVTSYSASHIATASETEKGFQLRDYFIDCEKNLQIGQEQYDRLAETVLAQNAQIAQLTIELKSKPKRLPPPPIDNTLKQTLIKVHDGYHRILTTCSPIDMMKELSGMTCLFQLIGSTIGDGKNLNTQTKAGHGYWGDHRKIQQPKQLN